MTRSFSVPRPRFITHSLSALPLCLLFGAAACTSGNGEGAVRATIYGEEFIEEGIPEDAFDDGWSVEFDRFSVRVSNVHIGDIPLEVGGTKDLTKASDGEGQELGVAEAPAGKLVDSGYTIERIVVAGRAKKGKSEKTFRWTFDDPTRYDECEPETRVEPGETATFQITIHADHLFSDSLVSEEPKLLFQPLADADLDDDGEITREELAEVDIGAYDPGSEGGVDDLWTWLVRLSKTVGHADGEGHCHVHDEP